MTILPKNALLWIHVYSPETFKTDTIPFENPDMYGV